MRISGAFLAGLIPAALWAQDRPLSAIDWLSKAPPVVFEDPVLLEPPVAKTGSIPSVAVQTLEQTAPLVGLVPAATTGLPESLWDHSTPQILERLIANAPVLRSPPMQQLLFTLLLADARAPVGDDGAVLLARARRLIDLGASDAALALLDQVGADQSASIFAMWFEASLLIGDESRGCQVLERTPRLSPDEAVRIYCAALTGDWNTAALLAESAHALKTIPLARLNLIDRYLSPDIFEDAPALPQPQSPTVLDVRLAEAIGEPMSIASLPRAFAPIDLRDVAGWKGQIEAAERLVRSSALEPNRLLGLYTERKAAASGGVWDRVRAMQRFERALEQGDLAEIGAALPLIWDQMVQLGLQSAFAGLFEDRLSALNIDETSTRTLIWHIALLSPNYENAALAMPDNTPMSVFLSELALGKPMRADQLNPLALAIADGFAVEAKVPANLTLMRDEGALGAYILSAIALFDTGAQGDLNALSSALSAFRAIGLEDTARRAALHLLLKKATRT